MKVIIILSIAYLLFFNNLGGIALWDPDEPRQAIMAREMMERGDYIHPYLNGRPYLEKPPFYPWMIALTAKIKGRLDESASRIPAAISALLLMLITYSIGTMLVDRSCGLLSAIVLATNYQFLSNARESVMDMTFAFFIGLTVYLNYLAIRKDRRILFILSFMPSAFGILTKGPAGLALPCLTTFFYLIFQKRLKRFIIPMVVGCIVSAGIASIWFFLAGEEYFREFIFRQNITRYTNAFDHIESSLYYFHKLFFNFLPWSLLLPFALFYAFKKRMWLLLIWFVTTFMFYELSKSKRAIYLLSLYPACALLCGLYIRDKWSWMVKTGWIRMILGIFMLIMMLLPVISIFTFDFIPSVIMAELKKSLFLFYGFVSIIFVIGLIQLYLLYRKKEKGVLITFIIYLSSLGLFYNVLYMPVMDRALKSPRLITDNLKAIEKGKDIYTYGFSSAGIIFYIGRPINTLVDIKEIKDKKNDILLIAEDDEVPPSMKKVLDEGFHGVGRARYEKERYTFYVRKKE